MGTPADRGAWAFRRARGSSASGVGWLRSSRAVFVLDAAGDVVAASRPIAGLALAELDDVPFVALVEEHHRDAVAAALGDALRTGAACVVDVPLLAERGGVVRYRRRFAPMRPAGEDVAGVLVACAS